MKLIPDGMVPVSLLFLFVSCGTNTTEPNQRLLIEGIEVELPANKKVIDFRTSRWEQERIKIMLLTRDDDDKVETYYIRKSLEDNRTILERSLYYGYAAPLPDAQLLESLPKKEIPIRIVKASCQTREIQYICVASLGLSVVRNSIFPEYTLTILKKSGDRYIPIYSLDDAGGNLQQLIFRDLDGDCLPELIDIEHLGDAFVNVRRINTENVVEDVQELKGKSVRVNELDTGRLLLYIYDRPGGYEGYWEEFVWSKTDGKFMSLAPPPIGAPVRR